MANVKFNVGGIIIERDLDEISQISGEGKEIELKSDDMVVHKSEDFETLKNNIKKSGYDEGKVIGVEMAVKTGREKFGLEFEGKTLDNFAEALKTKIESESKLEPNAKIKTLQADLEKMQGNYKTLQGDFDTYKDQISQKETRAKKDNFLVGFLPKDGVIVDNDIALMAIKSKLGIDADFNENNKLVVTKNGEVVKNDLLEPIDPFVYIKDQVEKLGLITKKKSNSRGDDDEPGEGDQSSYDKFVKRMEANNIKEGSIEFNKEMQKEIKAGTLKF